MPVGKEGGKRRMGKGKKKRQKQSQKRKMVSNTRCPYVNVCECDGERGSGPEGTDDLCLVSFNGLRLEFEPCYKDLRFKAEI